MDKVIKKIFKRFIRCLSKMNDFIINIFTIILVKGMIELLNKMFIRVNRRGWQCEKSFLNAFFKNENEQHVCNILSVNTMMSENFKKMSGMLKNGCSTISFKLQI